MSVLEILDTLLLKPLYLLFEVVYVMADKVIGNPGLSIIVLSLFMNFLVLPLYMRADAIQEEEHAVEKKLQKGVEHIKKTFSGDERMMMLQTYYRQNHYKPMYVLRSAVSLFLQIPFFIAAYDSGKSGVLCDLYKGKPAEIKNTIVCHGSVLSGIFIHVSGRACFLLDIKQCVFSDKNNFLQIEKSGKSA